MAAPAYKRILLKLSGEALMGDDSYGINRSTITRIVDEIKEVVDLGVQVAVVIGGGTFFAELLRLLRGWIEQPRIIWVCWLL